MASSQYERKLNRYRKLRETLGVKGGSAAISGHYQQSEHDYPEPTATRPLAQRGTHDVIVPGTASLAFKITLNSEDANRTVVQNLGRAIVKKTIIKISGNEVMSLYDSDVYHCYNDLWKTSQEENAQYQGIDESDNRNTTRFRVSAGK